MLRVAGGLFSEEQLRSGRKHGEIAENLRFYCPSLQGSMPEMDDQKMGGRDRCEQFCTGYGECNPGEIDVVAMPLELFQERWRGMCISSGAEAHVVRHG
jgi:hypothetical protein